MTFAMSVSLLALVVALTAAIPGVVLVLRRQAMLSDALSHAVLPGIAVGALWTTNPNSPILLIGATLSGVLVMALTEWVRGRKRVTEDSATGLIFPAFFAIGVILISTKFNRSSISEHTVLVGDLNISAMQHLVVGTIDFGPKSAWIIGAVGLLTLALLLVAKRPLAISTFDPVFARTVGIRTRLINYLVMTMVSLTIVVVFDAAGAVLAVALMIVPAATALMIASSEGAMLLVTLVVAAVGSQAGFWVAYRLDAATSPTMAFVDGLIFLAVWVIIRARRRLQH